MGNLKHTLVYIVAFSFAPNLLARECVNLFGQNHELSRIIEQFASTKSSQIFARLLLEDSNRSLQSLSEKHDRPIVMVTDIEGLHRLSKKGINTALAELGYTKEHVFYLKSLGYDFKLIILKTEQKSILANWDGVYEVLRSSYNMASQILFQRYRQDLYNLSFTEIESLGPTNFRKAYELGEQDPLYIKASNLNANSTLWELRAFLYNELRLTELYTGDGYTTKDQSQKGVKEYFIQNQYLKKIEDYALIDL